jgi:hypothetical protein
MLIQLDAGSVVLRTMKRTSVTGPAATAATTETKDKVDALIRDDRRITSELCNAVGIGKQAIMTIIKELVYRKAFARGCRNPHCRTQNSVKENILQKFSRAVRKAEMLFCQEKL